MASERNGRQFGVTEPLSASGPAEMDLARNRELEKYLASAGLYESQEESVLREEVLGRLDQIVKIWVKKISLNKGYSDQFVQEANAKIFTFGSYRLGEHCFWWDIRGIAGTRSHLSSMSAWKATMAIMLYEQPFSSLQLCMPAEIIVGITLLQPLAMGPGGLPAFTALIHY